jgi:hypothetical protein
MMMMMSIFTGERKGVPKEDLSFLGGAYTRLV